MLYVAQFYSKKKCIEIVEQTMTTSIIPIVSFIHACMHAYTYTDVLYLSVGWSSLFVAMQRFFTCIPSSIELHAT